MVLGGDILATKILLGQYGNVSHRYSSIGSDRLGISRSYIDLMPWYLCRLVAG